MSSGVVESEHAVAGVDVAVAVGLAAVTAIWLVAHTRLRSRGRF